MIVMDPTSTLINQQYVNVHATTKGDDCVHSPAPSLLVEYDWQLALLWNHEMVAAGVTTCLSSVL